LPLFPGASTLIGTVDQASVPITGLLQAPKTVDRGALRHALGSLSQGIRFGPIQIENNGLMSPRDPNTPEPNFAQLVTEDQIPYITVSAHALRRFVQRLQPDIPGADQVAEPMARLEDLGTGNRSDAEQVQLNRYRDWMTRHVEPHVRDLIRCEGFWTTERPRWSRSDTQSAGYLQVGRMCGFPAADKDGIRTLTTCTNGRDITWDIALERRYTLMPKPYTDQAPQLLRAPAWATIALRAWRSRSRHKGLLAAYRAERTTAIEETRRENERRQADHQAAKDAYQAQSERAQRAFSNRHSAGGQ